MKTYTCNWKKITASETKSSSFCCTRNLHIPSNFDPLMLCFEIRNEATAGPGHHIAGDGLPLDGPRAPHDAHVVRFRTPQRQQPLGDRVVWTLGTG